MQKLLSNYKTNNSGTYILKWFEFSSRQVGSRICLREISTKNFKNMIPSAHFWFDWHWFCFKTSLTHILLSFCAFQVKIWLICDIGGKNCIFTPHAHTPISKWFLKMIGRIVCVSFTTIQNFIVIPPILAEKNIIL